MGSTRLPGKVLADLGGRPMLAFLLDRLERLPVDQVVVATSDLDRDDAVVEVAEAAGVGVVRGPELDVLARFALALQCHPAGNVVRITADCPLTDPAIVAASIALHVDSRADYTCNVLPRTFPQGLDVEVIAADALRLADQEAQRAIEREHVTPYLYRHPERFRLANLRSGEDLGDERWTVDTPADLEVVREIVRRVGPDPAFTWREALGAVGRRAPRPPATLRLRPADLRDVGPVFAWCHDADAVQFTLADPEVHPDDRAQWFAALLDDPATRLFIGDLDGRSTGVVRVDVEDAIGTVHVAVDREHAAPGLGHALLVALLEDLKGDVGVDRLVARVRDDDREAMRWFPGAGFSFAGSDEGISRFTWDNARR